ncbi:LptA/OstA family protein [Novosphingobium sp.]|uniref:LptA/OstA family protein n=1 Tax=Novosphingobium sp. TaxID=1874826 RepID=UPI0025E8E282|nr:LptA/OstA family protein [Novosphingobium sp.]MCC6925502.1 LptA/OstA family protein [Novosphingobium sp.]
MRALTMTPLRRTVLRSALGGFAISTAALLALAPGQAQVFGGHNSDAPVSVSADHGELLGRQDRATLAGNVVISQGNLTLRAARTTLAFSSDAGSFKIHRLDATGGVQVTKGDQSATGDVAIYDFDRRIITMAGGVVLKRGNDRLTGGRLVIDLNSGVSTVDGSAGGGSSALGTPGAGSRGGRITGTFTVPKRN